MVVVQAGSSTAQDREKYLYRWFPLRKLFTGCSSLLIFCIMVPDISCCHYPYPYPKRLSTTAVTPPPPSTHTLSHPSREEHKCPEEGACN